MPKSSTLSYWFVLIVVNSEFAALPTTGEKNCEGFGECVIFAGYTCKNNKCVCDPDETSLFRCITPKYFGERCNSDQECQLGDYNSYCLKSEIRICKCKRTYFWDLEKKKCVSMEEDDMYGGKFDPVRELIIPGLIIMTIAAMFYLGFKLFCNFGKLWRRKRQREIEREFRELTGVGRQQAWIASYRLYGPYESSNRSSSALPPTSFSLHTTPCVGLFVSSQSLSQGPPPYEEALKHKVILNDYYKLSSPYSIPTPYSPRHHHITPNAPPSSSLNLDQGMSTPPPLMPKPGTRPSLNSPNSRERLLAELQNPGIPPDPVPETNASSQMSKIVRRYGLTGVGVWVPYSEQTQPPVLPPRSETYKPDQPQKVYYGSDLRQSYQNN